MSLNGVQYWAQQNVFTGITSQYYKPTVCYIQPPAPGKITNGTPHIYIYDQRGKKIRATQQFGAGFIELQHELSAFIMMIQPIKAENPDQMFFNLIDNVSIACWTQVPGQAIVDPITNVTSQLMNFGEQFDWEVGLPMRATQAGQMIYRAVITVSAKERIVA